MSPWQILGDVVGWVLLGLLAFVVLAFLWALILTVVKSVRKPRGKATQIYVSDRK